jgi:chemotaxis protein methyltransferase CheR
MASDTHPEDVTEEDFRRLAEFLYRRTGMVFTEAKRYFVVRRLGERMNATGRRSFAAYFALLRSGGGGEVEQLINSFTVNETYFYREDDQFRCLTASLLGLLTTRRQPGDTIRIWSSPCSTGEEPYSIAIWLLENWPAVDAWNIEIVGSDIDTRALEAAVDGYYGARALMRLSEPLISRYFERESDGARRIIADLRNSVRFTSVNIVDPAEVRGQGRFDVIFCRNVLIYFDDASRRLAAENLFEALVPGGFICLGHTESMSRISPLFRACRFADAIVYQRPLEGEHV